METLAPTNFPYLIARACTALPHTPAFQELPDGFLRIVLLIVQKINIKNPYTSIFAARATIATEAGKSTDSVHRAIKWLEDKGYIERERKAFFGNRGSTSPITPTKELLMVLALVDEDGKPLAVKDTPAHRKDPTRKVVGHEGDAQSEGDVRSGSSAFVKVGKVLVPKDLAWMCDVGVSSFGVLALMKAAREAKQRLSDVMATARKYVEGLPAREIFAYVRKLIVSGRDFGYLANKSSELRKNEKNSEFLSEKIRNMEGLSFLSRKSGRTFEITEGVLYEVSAQGQRTVHIFSNAFVDAIHEGKLVPHRNGTW